MGQIINTIVVAWNINKLHSGAVNEWQFCFSPKAGLGHCHQPSRIYQVLMGIWTPSVIQRHHDV